MISFQVNDMTCGHCVASITRAVAAVDPGSVVSTDLARHLVHVRSTGADPQELQDAIAAAGYTPVAVEVPETAVTKGPRSGGCCCGSGSSRCG